MTHPFKPSDSIFVNGYVFLSFAKNISKNISKNSSSEYGQRHLDHDKQSATDAFKAASIGNKAPDKFRRTASKSAPRTASKSILKTSSSNAKHTDFVCMSQKKYKKLLMSLD